MRLALIFALILAAMAACSGGSSNTSPTPENHVLTGIVKMNGPTCESLPTSDFATLPGTKITLNDGQGTVLGTGKLSAQGVTTESPPACTLHFSIPNVAVAASYSITSSAFNPVSYTYDEMKADNWTIAVGIGK